MGEQELSLEENNQLACSTRKMKRTVMDLPSEGESIEDVVADDMDLALAGWLKMGTKQVQTHGDRVEDYTQGRSISYRDTLQINSPNLTVDTRDKPV